MAALFPGLTEQDSGEMKLVYTHDNFALVGLARSLLESAGIEVMMKNEFGGTGFPPYNQGSEIWVVHDKDKDAAETILSEVSEIQDSED